MRIPLLFAALCLGASLGAQTNVAFKSKLTYTGKHLSNLWGYSDGAHEYALVGTFTGTSIVDVTDPLNPVILMEVDGPDSDWREIKTWQHYAYVVSEGTTPAAGIQVINLSGLPGNVSSYNCTTQSGIGITKGHALHVDVVKGYLYVYGTNLFSGKPMIFNLNNTPDTPKYVTYYNNIGYGHDGYVNNDTMFSAHINAGQMAVVNMANKTSPVTWDIVTTPNAFTHNTWRSGNTIYTTDEKSGAYLASYDISDPANVTFLDKIRSNPGSGSIVHNTYIRDNYAVTSWYKDGFTITDVARPQNLIQVGNYDTYPGSGNGFNGCWGVYPYLPSGNIIASNIDGTSASNGELWILDPTYVRGCYLEGIVTHAVTGQPLDGATVKVLGTSMQENSGHTGLPGDYKMGQLGAGTFTLQVSKIGFVTFSTSVTLDNGVLTVKNVPLQPVAAPVEWKFFTARAEGKKALLEWATGAETDNKGFSVQYSASGTYWKDLVFLPGKGRPSQDAEYEYITEDLPSGIHYFRLEQRDFDGSISYSEIRQITVGGGLSTAWMHPNPAGEEIALNLTLDRPEYLGIRVFDATMRPVLEIPETYYEAGPVSIPVGLEGLKGGVYKVLLFSPQEHAALQVVKM